MRITGGIHRSRKLETPKNDAVRPTSDKVRQAIFNMLNARCLVQDAIVIDAFCGTGALGLEALSQGAHHCTFFDKNKSSIYLCQANIEKLKEEDRSVIIMGDVTNIKECPDQNPKASLVFLDPPYNQNFISKTIESLKNKNWLSQDCFFVIEAAKNELINLEYLKIQNEKIYGDTKVILSSF